MQQVFITVIKELLQATRNELAVESFIPQSYRKSKQRDISVGFHFFGIAHWTKKVCFDHIFDKNDEPARLGPARPNPAQPNPALTLFGGLFLSQFKR